MVNEKKLRVMPDASFKCMTWLYNFTDLIRNPQRRLKKIPLKEGMVVLDYGCGPGRYTLPVARLVGPTGKVFAVDIQPLAISMIKEKATSESLTNIEAILVNSYDTGIQDSSVDLVLFLDTLHIIGNPNALFREIHRLLKQDGFIFMDSGHMKIAKACKIVENTGFFRIAECWGKDMLVSLKTKQ